MATFAELDENNNVLNVIKVSDADCIGGNFPESEPVGIEYLKEHFGQNKIWKQTSINMKFRKHRATVGGKYDPDLDAFLLPKTPGMEDFVLDENLVWIPPIPKPDNTQPYRYNLQTKQWDPVPKPYPSWVLRVGRVDCIWVPPTAPPEDARTTPYKWDEDTLSWVKIGT